jgi:hypothetical protein
MWMKLMLPQTRKVLTPERLTMYEYALDAPVETFIMDKAPKALVMRIAQTGTPLLLVQPKNLGALPDCAMYRTVRDPM